MNASLAVLVVEDDFLIRTCLMEFLQDSGMAVREAENCAEAAEAVRSEPVLHALVADLTLPDGDGMAITHLARDKWPDLPVIYISGHGALRRDETSGDPARDRFISKPYTLASILEAIEDMTGSSTS
ncbi:response regulator [Gluconobacter wancherniae]|uniref:Response regulatory domain-containing protein n=1 Tax=Gluconobacter wancherniae NBRC 103581 TaxID=656744 RepID=A0A511B4X8_9PROT|nr:response regulator [Gluconobacter wancherniae]MBF0853061.1 response regulator [Gluconobacter wancherniae]MBS1087948.1 response regulator [Gluconobacter wancherniae]MBS1093641.1 response regulator [Gluconobacter wancherniae]GBD56221.1 two-component system sensor histidine kinase/response regulator [Gluconobacter wancherniae NBRC 103581]GBR63432.1 two-component transcriptional regulator [Gluconobacter wancherniae NBRC 103581]